MEENKPLATSEEQITVDDSNGENHLDASQVLDTPMDELAQTEQVSQQPEEPSSLDSTMAEVESGEAVPGTDTTHVESAAMEVSEETEIIDNSILHSQSPVTQPENQSSEEPAPAPATISEAPETVADAPESSSEAPVADSEVPTTTSETPSVASEVQPVASEPPSVVSEAAEEAVVEATTEAETTTETAAASESPAAASKTPSPSDHVAPQKTASESMEVEPAHNSPLLSAPASWQIPPGALQAKPETSNVNFINEAANRANQKRERLEQRIAEYKYDVDAWSALINDVQQTGDLAATREVYERLLQVFPSSPRHWLAYLELELKYSNFNEVETLFTRCLKTVLSVDLWKFYLGYIRRINQGENGSATTLEARSIIEKAYEYVLNNVGIDKEAGPIWADYIFFLKSAETSNTWEEQRKMDSMRRAYQKAVTIPLNNVEHLWKEYDQWENNLNRLTAKKFLGEKSPAYMTARTALREMRAFTDNLNRGAVPRPPQWTEKEVQQLRLWKQYIQWEKGDPLQLDDSNAVMERVAYAYQQAFLVLRFYPEMWYDFANYYVECGKPEKALSILKQGLEILPTSLLLHFAYAELCESRRQLDDARQAFDSLLEHLDADIEKEKSTAQAEIAKLQEAFDTEKAGMNLTDDIDGELREQLRSRERHVKKEQEEIEERTNERVNVIARACSLTWICYMRFARRTEGIKAARALFSRARKTPNRTYHVFIASALMEYHNSKDATVAGKIFGLGLKQFADDPAYVCEYLDFLIQMNDDNNTRALFERTLATMPATKALPIWDKFLDYENKYGDLAGIQSVEKRRSEALPSTSPLESFLQRNTYLNIHSIEELELGGEAGLQKSSETSTAANTASETTPAHISGQDRHSRSKDAQGKRPLLEAVHPEKYPRPDLSQWLSFKPTETRRTPAPPSTATPAVPAETKLIPPQQQEIVPPPVVPPVSAAPPAAAVLGVGTGPMPGAAPVPGGVQGLAPVPGPGPSGMMPPPPVAAPMGGANAGSGPGSWNNAPAKPPMKQLPEPVAYFVSSLPPAQTFNGPSIQAAELVELLRNIIIPLPPGAPNMAPLPGRGQPPKPMGGPPMQQLPGRDMPPGRGGFNGPGGRGGRGSGFKNRGGPSSRGKQGAKRRTRDDYEDDFQQHKGMGPNRPPAHDVFRARQAKRHRDDPPF